MESSAEMLKEIACPNIIVKPLKKSLFSLWFGEGGVFRNVFITAVEKQSYLRTHVITPEANAKREQYNWTS